MPSDIVQRMRWWADKRVAPKSMPTLVTDCREAADRIEALESKVEELESALKPFNTGWADADGWNDTACQGDRIVDWFGPSDFRAVAAVLSQTKAPVPADKPFTFADPAAQREWERQRKERGAE